MRRALDRNVVETVFIIAMATVVASCSSDDSKAPTDGGDTGTGTDADTDTDTDSDSDTGPEPVDPEIDWVDIPAGSFTFGSPEDTPCRGPYGEREYSVTLTRPFVMARHEVTQREWAALGFQVPHNQAYCDDCPVTYLDFYEAAAWCNALSRFEDLEECYDLSDCTGEIGSGCPEGDFYNAMCFAEEGVSPPTILAQIYNCAGDVRRHASMYDCGGYRLPTGAEWEHAAKAGTTTNTYNGDITEDSHGLCIGEPVLNDIAWYCFNTGAGTDGWETGLYLHEACEKEPNPFGLCDVLGNAFEWADYVGDGQPLGGWGNYDPLTDPMGRPWNSVDADLRGSDFKRETCRTRSAYQFSAWPYERRAGSGFRPVRTLPATAPDAGAGDSGVK